MQYYPKFLYSNDFIEVMFLMTWRWFYIGGMIKKDGEIYISGRAICDALGITRQQLNYYCSNYMTSPLMRRRLAYTNVRIGKYKRKKLTNHYSLLFFLMIAFRTNSPRAQLFLRLFYEHFVRIKKNDRDYFVDEAELMFVL